jgi:hypothetical protein
MQYHKCTATLKFSLDKKIDSRKIKLLSDPNLYATHTFLIANSLLLSQMGGI